MTWSSRTDWTYAQISLLWELAGSDMPLSDISSRVGKKLDEICDKAAELGITLASCHSRTTREKMPEKEKGA
jgi:hypothetical protein